MAVRLKIRGKLVLSFSAVMVLVLSGLGYITYLTFADSIHSHKEEIASLKLEAIGLDAAQSITRSELAFNQAVVRLITSDATPGDLLASADASLGLLNSSGQWAELAGPEASLAGYLAAGRQNPDEGVAFADTSIIYASPWFTHPRHGRVQALSSVPYDQVFSDVVALANADTADIFIARGERLLTHEDHEGFDYSRITALQSDPAYEARLTRLDDLYAMRKTLERVDLNIWYVLEESIYLESIIELKNRVIAATVIILWASIWIVLIVAYRIARPIRDLTDATKDMQESEYSAPLNYKRTGDEVSDLGQRFEEMRLHIEGLISRDPLSGLFNRRYLMHALEIEINKAKRGEQPLCCLMMDLDHFKGVNDTYGHQCGDKVIQSTAAIIQRSLRNYDICARYGGEEFVVILPMTNLQGAKEVAERIRVTVEGSPIEWEGKIVSPTVSVGVSLYQLGSEDSHGEAMIGVADEALYLAKRAGRNCVMDGSSVANLME